MMHKQGKRSTNQRKHALALNINDAIFQGINLGLKKYVVNSHIIRISVS